MKHRGFTIIESLVAIAILSVAIMGAMSAAQTGLSSYIFSKEQIISFYIAQEGFEQIRNIRDENRLNNRNWLTGIAANTSDPCSFGEPCTVSPAQTNLALRCGSGPGCLYLKQDPTTGLYGYDANWPATPFRREIRIYAVSPTEITVVVTVRWSKGAVDRQFVARENLLNW